MLLTNLCICQGFKYVGGETDMQFLVGKRHVVAASYDDDQDL